MADERAKPDANRAKAGVVSGVTDNASLEIVQLRVDPTSKRLKVDASISSYTGVVDGEAVEATDTGTLILGTDGSNYQVLATDATGNLQVEVLTAPTTAVTGTFWQGTQPVSVATIPSHAVTNIGTFAVQSTNDSLIGPGDPTIDSYTQLAINLNAGADQVLVSSAANKQIWVYGVAFTLSVAGTVSFQDEDNTAITGIMDFAANSGLNTPTSGNFAMPIWKLATDKDLEVDVVTAAIDGWLNYAIVSV